MIYKENAAQYFRAKQLLLEKGEWEGEIRQYTKDGREIIAESRWTLVRDDRGSPKSILVINTDITEKKKHRSPVPSRAAHGEHRHARGRHRA